MANLLTVVFLASAFIANCHTLHLRQYYIGFAKRPATLDFFGIEGYQDEILDMIMEQNGYKDLKGFTVQKDELCGGSLEKYDFMCMGLVEGGLRHVVSFKIGLPIIKLLGFNDVYKAEIGLNVDLQKIVFFGTDQPFHTEFNADTYCKIIIKNQEDDEIKSLVIDAKSDMQRVLRENSITGKDAGIPYEYGYIIEVQAKEPNRAFWRSTSSDSSYKRFESINEKFVVIDDDIVTYESYVRDHHALLVEWQKNYDEWKQEMVRQTTELKPTLNNDQRLAWENDKISQLNDKLHSLRQDMHIIKNSREINKLKMQVRKLESRINAKFAELERRFDELKNQIASASGSSCSSGFDSVSSVFSLIPGFGTILSALSDIASASCLIRGSN